MAFISDVHGNLTALEAVLVELRRQAIVDLFVAGDLLLGGGEPMQVWTRLQSLHAHCVRGPSDTALASMDPGRLRPSTPAEQAAAERFADTRRALGDLVLRRLRELPERLRLPMIDGRELLMVHGSPADPSEALSHDLEDEEMMALVGDDPADMVVCGATHVPFIRTLAEVQIINVGSVGEAPGDPRIAHYTIVSPKVSGATIEQSWVEY
jgi:predicted phosphodiesterase